ncbi:L-threonylcarbamoyladenylate synthase [Ihubacter sp. rT4E-8]|uniref:L-threonylcarbamoyladenylate synthase n=1 Tax=Ihubacter sp. rT4E-8 TaxID=3242369 RepID=UPI003CF0C6C4
MKTKFFKDTKEDLQRAAEIIASGGLVAFPTETVYGLGADALNPEAVAKVYAAKGRPSDNPMIVHISSKDDLIKLTPRITADMEKLMGAFWPGPMTMIVPRLSVVPDVTTGGLYTVGIRMPDHPAALELIRFSRCPIAAPSANLSGKPSPTTAGHVVDDLSGRIDAVVCGEDCQVGIESSVIDVTTDAPMILRPGIITKEDFERALGKPVALDPTLNRRPDTFNNDEFKPKAPGMKYKHYAPKAEMIIFEGVPEAARRAMEAEKTAREDAGQKVCLISFDEGEEVTAAHDFFRRLREADEAGTDVILTMALCEEGVGFSVMNRMLKSAGYNIRKV